MEHNRGYIWTMWVGGSMALGLLLMWLFSNFFYDLFWAILDEHHVRQADVIAYTMAHLVPFVLAIIVVVGIYFLPRHYVAKQVEIMPPQLGERLSYLSARDYDLGPAIIEMAYRSAWGRWFAAREFVTTSKPIDERYWFQTAASKVHAKMKDGDLIVRGRMQGKTGIEVIPQTDWRDVALYYFPDDRTLWRLRVLPREGVTIQDNQVIRTDLSMETVNHITQYDSLLVDSRQFENLWPIADEIADSERRQFLKEAMRRKLDRNIIQALS